MCSVNLLDENLVLWNNFRDGDANAFGELMRLHYADLYNYGTRFTKKSELVKDCIQDLFLSLWKNRTTISETTFVKYYLLKSLRRLLHRAVGREKRSYISMYKEFEFERLFNENDSIENKIVLNEQYLEISMKMRKLLGNLTKRQQEVIYLRFFMDADIDEIVDITSLNKQSVYNLLSDALKKLKKLTSQKSFSFSSFFNTWLF